MIEGPAQRPASARVECVTCHRGVAIPRQITDIVWKAVVQEGGAAAAAQYRALRTQYYGSQSYDFREEPLLLLVQSFIEARPEDAVALLEMNIEFHPNSSRGYSLLGYAYTRNYDHPSAVAALEKALALNPDDNVARGRLEQLRTYRRKP
jgi:cytochrome c-type biogenesis protein CcmH/NrfG